MAHDSAKQADTIFEDDPKNVTPSVAAKYRAPNYSPRPPTDTSFETVLPYSACDAASLDPQWWNEYLDIRMKAMQEDLEERLRQFFNTREKAMQDDLEDRLLRQSFNGRDRENRDRDSYVLAKEIGNAMGAQVDESMLQSERITALEDSFSELSRDCILIKNNLQEALQLFEAFAVAASVANDARTNHERLEFRIDSMERHLAGLGVFKDNESTAPDSHCSSLAPDMPELQVACRQIFNRLGSPTDQEVDTYTQVPAPESPATASRDTIKKNAVWSRANNNFGPHTARTSALSEANVQTSVLPDEASLPRVATPSTPLATVVSTSHSSHKFPARTSSPIPVRGGIATPRDGGSLKLPGAHPASNMQIGVVTETCVGSLSQVKSPCTLSTVTQEQDLEAINRTSLTRSATLPITLPLTNVQLEANRRILVPPATARSSLRAPSRNCSYATNHLVTQTGVVHAAPVSASTAVQAATMSSQSALGIKNLSHEHPIDAAGSLSIQSAASAIEALGIPASPTLRPRSLSPTQGTRNQNIAIVNYPYHPHSSAPSRNMGMQPLQPLSSARAGPNGATQRG